MRGVNEVTQMEKLPTPTVEEVLEEMNGNTAFSKLDMNMGFHQLNLRRDRGISQRFQLLIHCIVTRG